MTTNSPLISEQNFSEFIKKKLDTHVAALSWQPQQDTLWYLGNLLVTHTESRQLFVEKEGRKALPTLAFLFRDAHAASSQSERLAILRKLGDTALFIGALFPQCLTRRGLSKDYFVGMGGGAYSYLAENFPTENIVFDELSRRFPLALQLLASVCEKELVFDAQDILGLVERWRSTGDELIKRQLASLGIATFNTPGSLN